MSYLYLIIIIIIIIVIKNYSPFGGGYEAIVEFKEVDAARIAVHLTGTLFGGRPLCITLMDGSSVINSISSGAMTSAASRPFNTIPIQHQQPGVIANNPMLRMAV